MLVVVHDGLDKAEPAVDFNAASTEVALTIGLAFLKGLNMNLNYTPKEEIKSKNKC